MHNFDLRVWPTSLIMNLSNINVNDQHILSITQEPGHSTDAVMSQKAVTQSINLKLSPRDVLVMDFINVNAERGTGYINYQTGEVVSEGSSYTSDFIKLTNFKKLVSSNNNLDNSASPIAFYDKNKNYLQEISVQGGSGEAPIEIDLNQAKYLQASFVRFSGYSVFKGATLFNEREFTKSIYEEIITATTSIAGYVNYEGQIVEANGYHSPKTEITEKDILYIGSRGGLDRSTAVLSFYDENHNYIKDISVRGGEYFLNTIDLSQPQYSEAKYFIVSTWSGINSASIYRITQAPILEDLDALNLRVADLESNFLNDIVIYSKGHGSGYVNYNTGLLNGTPTDGYSTPFFKVKGYSQLVANNSGLVQGYAPIAFYDQCKNYLKSVSVEGNGQDNERIVIDLTDPQYADVYYCIVSGWKDNSASLTAPSSSIGDLEKDVAVLNSKVDAIFSENIEGETVLNSGYILYSTGQVAGVGGTGQSTDFIAVSGYKKITASNAGLDQSASPIAFYGKNKNYLQEISVQGNSTSGSITIDLTQSQYAQAAFVRFSGWGVNRFTIEVFQTFKPFLYGKNFCCLGDSISDGDGNSSYSWYDMLLVRYGAGAESLNFAKSGQVLRTMADRCTQKNMANIDYCFVMGGTNQVGVYSLGTINDTPTPDRWEAQKQYNVGDRVLGGASYKHGGIDTYYYWYECITAGTSGNTADATGFSTTTNETFTDGTVVWKCIGSPSWYSDLKGIIRRVWGFNPKIHIIWLVPIKTKADIGLIPSNWARAAKFQAIRTFCEAYSIKYIDLQKEFALNEFTRDAIMADNLHPNKVGYQIIQDIVSSHIE